MTSKKLVMANWRQVFASESQKSVDFYRACPEDLTVDRAFTAQTMYQGIQGPTLFREVRRVSWRDRIQSEVQALIDAPAGGKDESEEAFAHRILNALAYVIYNTWDPERFHLILHSSGYDSRLLSLALMKLHKRFGAEWLGEVHFVCQEWEWPVFEQIMEHEGWPESSYTSYRKDEDPHEYWREAISLSAWRGLNGPRGIPFCPIYTIPTELMRQRYFGDKRSSEVQMYSMICAPSDHGASSLSIHKQPANGIGNFFDWWYTSYMSHLWPPVSGANLVLPYTNVAFNHAILSSNVRWGRMLPRKAMAYLDPVLAKFPSLFDGVLNFNTVRTKPHRFLSHSLMEKAMDIYEASWYGQNVAHITELFARTEMYYDVWWGRWTSAVVCERLIARGHKLSVG